GTGLATIGPMGALGCSGKCHEAARPPPLSVYPATIPRPLGVPPESSTDGPTAPLSASALRASALKAGADHTGCGSVAAGAKFPPPPGRGARAPVPPFLFRPETKRGPCPPASP